MAYETVCPKCKGNNSKTFETCTCVVNTIAKKDCVVCKGKGKRACFTCDGIGKIYVTNNPW